MGHQSYIAVSGNESFLFGLGKGLRKICYLFKPSSGKYYHSQYILIENYCLNI